MLEKLDVKEWLKLNAQLQQKKNLLRKKLSEKGVLKQKSYNKFDNYSYFGEWQYKDLFTELFSECGLELKFDELAYNLFTGTSKQPYGRMPKLLFRLFDCETGFYEDTCITAEGIDKADKAGYKGYTGALKYYLANTFMVATGDEAEATEDQKDDQDEQQEDEQQEEPKERKASAKQVEILKANYTGENLDKLLKVNKVDKVEDIPMRKASFLISKLKERGNENGNDSSN